MEKDDEERRDDRGLFCGWGSPIDDEADVDDNDEDEDDAISGGKEAISTPCSFFLAKKNDEKAVRA